MKPCKGLVVQETTQRPPKIIEGGWTLPRGNKLVSGQTERHPGLPNLSRSPGQNASRPARKRTTHCLKQKQRVNGEGEKPTRQNATPVKNTSVELVNGHTTTTVNLPHNQGGILQKEEIQVIARMTIVQMNHIVREAMSRTPTQPLVQRLEVVIDKNVDGEMQPIPAHPVGYELKYQRTNLVSPCHGQGEGMLPMREYMMREAQEQGSAPATTS